MLVPANLLTTTGTLAGVGWGLASTQLFKLVGLASLSAGLLLLHVLSWLLVGVVMAPTYILFVLAIVCLGVNFWAVVAPQHLAQVLHYLRTLLTHKVNWLTSRA